MVIEQIKNEVIDGQNVTTTFYDDGQIKTVITNADGQELLDRLTDENNDIVYQVERAYHAGGALASVKKINHNKTREITTYRQDGQETSYEKTDHEGIILAQEIYEFFANGNLKKYVEKYKGEIDETKEYYENGTQKSLKNRHETKEYYPNGQLKYEEDKWLNSFTRYYENGVVEHKVSYERDKRRGTVLNYEEKRQPDGTLIYTFNGRYGYEEREISREYNQKGILIHESKVTDYGWGRETTDYDNDGLLFKKYECCDNTPGGGLSQYERLYKYDKKGRVILKEDRKANTSTTIIYNNTKRTEVTMARTDNTEVEMYLKGYGYVKAASQTAEYDGENLQSAVFKNLKGEIIGKYEAQYNDKNKRLKENYFFNFPDGSCMREDTAYYDNGAVAVRYLQKRNGQYKTEEYNSDGKKTYFASGPQKGVITEMKEYDPTGYKLLRSITEVSPMRLEYADYTGDETKKTLKDKSGKIISKTLITYHANGQIATSDTTSPKNLSQTSVAYDKHGTEIFRQRVGAFGRLMELYEAYPNGAKKRQIKTNKDGSQEEWTYGENGNETSYEKRNIDNTTSNQTLYPSGRVQLESIKDGVVIYWDTDKHNVKEKRDTRGKIFYKEYANGQKAYEKQTDGSVKEWYETKEILSVTDPKGNKTVFFKTGEERLKIAKDGSKRALYDDRQYLLISGRHCDKYGEDGGLSSTGEEQAANIGKFIAYAAEGKVDGVPNVIPPEVYSRSDNTRSAQTVDIILKTLDEMLPGTTRCQKTDDTYLNTPCWHQAKSELSIHSMCHCYDIADGDMGSIAFSIVGRDGFVVDRMVFNAQEIAAEVEKIAAKEKLLTQEMTKKLEGIKEKHTAQTAILRQIAEENISTDRVKPKRSKTEKQIIKSVLTKITESRTN